MISRIPLRLLNTIKPFNTIKIYTPFCKSLEKIDKTAQKLIKIVEKELKYEKTNYIIHDSAIQFTEKSGFKLIDEENNHEITLEKRVGDFKIIVQFQQRQANFDENVDEEEESQQKQNNQVSQTSFADFTVYLQKNNTQILCYECTSQQGEISVNQVSQIRDLESHQKIPRFQRGFTQYIGPDFVSLDEKLQLSLIDYLKDFGINQELGKFIEHYSLDKEQRLYMYWLSQLTTFLKK